jgi:hypothetical protein
MASGTQVVETSCSHLAFSLPGRSNLIPEEAQLTLAHGKLITLRASKKCTMGTGRVKLEAGWLDLWIWYERNVGVYILLVRVSA